MLIEQLVFGPVDRLRLWGRSVMFSAAIELAGRRLFWPLIVVALGVALTTGLLYGGEIVRVALTHSPWLFLGGFLLSWVNAHGGSKLWRLMLRWHSFALTSCLIQLAAGRLFEVSLHATMSWIVFAGAWLYGSVRALGVESAPAKAYTGASLGIALGYALGLLCTLLPRILQSDALAASDRWIGPGIAAVAALGCLTLFAWAPRIRSRHSPRD